MHLAMAFRSSLRLLREREMSSSIDSKNYERLTLSKAVRRGISLMGNLYSPHADVRSGRLERALRAEVDRLVRSKGYVAESPNPSVAAGLAAVRTACAYLATAFHEEAYLALLVANEHLADHFDGSLHGA